MRMNLFKSALTLASLGAVVSMQAYAADGDIITVNGKQYVVLTTGTKVRVQAGQGIAWMNAGGGTYGYVDDIASFGSTYNGYLDTSAATSNSAALTAVTALKETVQITEDLQARTAEVLDGQPSGVRLAMGASTPQQGMAAGSHYSRTGVWLNPAHTHISDSNPVTKFKGNLFTGSLHADA